jgi:hypothetical protein
MKLVQCLLQAVDKVFLSLDDEVRKLLDVELLLEIAAEEGRLDVEVMQFQSTCTMIATNGCTDQVR